MCVQELKSRHMVCITFFLWLRHLGMIAIIRLTCQKKDLTWGKCLQCTIWHNFYFFTWMQLITVTSCSPSLPCRFIVKSLVWLNGNSLMPTFFPCCLVANGTWWDMTDLFSLLGKLNLGNSLWQVLSTSGNMAALPKSYSPYLASWSKSGNKSKRI